ncbi:MAG TPA: HEAT repeat domain-containing protein [Bacteroidales bacterium]|nr:HEAT repeat domain-containing protein [Bacteroidales bacterium]
MKKFIVTYLLIPIGLFIVFNLVVLLIVSWGTKSTIEESIVKNINIAREKYPGKAEDALIAFMQDTTNSYHDRSHVAIWTLGQIKSQKALPLIKELYTGEYCKGRHDRVICQSVVQNAIKAIESDWKLHPEFNK